MSSHDTHPPDRDARPSPPSIPPKAADDPPQLDIRLDSGSGDGFGSSTFNLSTDRVVPDPILGALDEASVEPVDSAPVSGSFSLPDTPRLADPLTSSEFGTLTGLNLDVTAAPKSAHVESALRGVDEDDEEVESVNGPNWPMLLLASYASAVTLALIWWVVIPKFRGKGEIEGFTPGASTVAVGTRRADRSHKVEPAPPIPPGQMIRLGQSLKIGSLEITPLETAREDVKLRRSLISGGTEDREGGSGAMALRIRLHNTSKDVVFSPLDESFIRDKDSGVSDSFVELPSSDRVYLYPLPIESEWAIIDQAFPTLKPGEVKETRIVTSADFPSAPAGMIWRLRLRTGLDATDLIGVSIPPTK